MKKLITESISLSLARYIQFLLRIVRGFLLAKILGPTLYGNWGAINLLFGYTQNSHLGLLHGMNKEAPFYIGQGQVEKATHIKNTAYTLTLFISFIISLALLFFVFINRRHLSSINYYGIIVVAILLIMYQIYNFHIAICRLRGDILLISIMELILTSCTLFFVIPLAYFYSIYGVFVGILIAYFVSLILLLSNMKELLHIEVHKEYIPMLFKVGIPILGIGFASDVFNTIDRLMIIKYLNMTRLGYYEVALSFSGLIYYVPNAVAYIIFPRFSEEFGRLKGDIKGLKNHVYNPTAAVAYVMPFVIFTIYFFCELPIKFFLKKYIPSISIIRILIMGAFFSGIASIPANFLIAVNKYISILKIQAIYILLAVIFNYIFIKLGQGIRGVALATAAVNFLYSTTILYLVFQNYYSNLKMSIEIFKLYSFFVFSAIIVFFISLFEFNLNSQFFWHHLGACLIKTTIYLLMNIALFAFMYNKNRIVTQLINFILKK